MFNPKTEGRGSEKVTRCFTPSQSLRLYQGGEGGGVERETLTLTDFIDIRP